MPPFEHTFRPLVAHATTMAGEDVAQADQVVGDHVQPELGADVVPAPQLVPPARSACGLGRNWRRPPNCSEASRQQRCEVRHGLHPRIKQWSIWGTTPRRAALRAEGSSGDRVSIHEASGDTRKVLVRIVWHRTRWSTCNTDWKDPMPHGISNNLHSP